MPCRPTCLKSVVGPNTNGPVPCCGPFNSCRAVLGSDQKFCAAGRPIWQGPIYIQLQTSAEAGYERFPPGHDTPTSRCYPSCMSACAKLKPIAAAAGRSTPSRLPRPAPWPPSGPRRPLSSLPRAASATSSHPRFISLAQSPPSRASRQRLVRTIPGSSFLLIAIPLFLCRVLQILRATSPGSVRLGASVLYVLIVIQKRKEIVIHLPDSTYL